MPDGTTQGYCIMPDSRIPYESFRHQNTPQTPDEIFCRSCGVIGEYHQTPGTGPHYAALSCGACGSHIKWLPRPRPPRRPTEKQIAFLHALGHRGAMPETLQEASERIDALLRDKGKGVRYV